MKKILFLIIIFGVQNLAFSQCNFGTGLISVNTAPFASGSASVIVSGNDVTVIANTNMPGGIYNFNNFTVNAGVTLNVVSGNGPLEIRCTGTATINGTIRSDGGNGGIGATGVFGGGTGGTGGTGGGGWGASGGTGGTTGSNQNGLNGSNFGTSSGRGLGGTGTFSSSPFYGAGGGGAGYSVNGLNGATNDGGAGGAGGQAYGDAGLTITMTHLGITSNLLGGSGGGGGGHRGSITTHGGGGGGGGGGAIGITANSISFGASGLVSAKGGNGGTSTNNGGAYGGSGGGGSGGTILLQSSNISGFTAGTNSDVSGGSGGLSPVGTTISAGGNGAPGRVLTLPCGIQVNTITTGTITGSPFCVGSTFNVPFTSSGTFVSGNVYTAQLSNASGSFASPVNIGTLNSTANSGNISVTVPGGTPNGNGYQIRIISSNPSTTGSSSTAFTINNTIVPISITPAGPVQVCQGQSVTLQAQSGFNNYVWSPGNISGSSITVSQTGSYSVTAQTAQGCQAASTAVQVTISTVSLLLNVTASGPLSICPGQSVTLTAEAGTTDLLWSNNATSNSITITQAGTYSVTGKNSLGCDVASEEFVVTIDNSVGLLAVTASGSLAICEGQSVTLTADANANNVVWSTTETTQAITISQAGDYSATAENENGCTLASEIFTVTVGVAEPGSITVTPAGPVQVCEGVPVTLTAATGFTNYVWSNEEQGESITVTTSGEFSVTALNSEGCLASSLPVEVIEVEIPVASFNYNQDLSGYTVQFTNTSVDGFQYSWTFSPGNTSTQANPSFTYPFDGVYPVRLIVTNACGSDTIVINIIVVKPVGINDLKADFTSIKVSPNPTNGLSVISGETQSRETYNLTIYNSIGQRIITEQLNVNGVWNKNIDLEAFPKGMYWISIDNKEGRITKKLVKI